MPSPSSNNNASRNPLSSVFASSLFSSKQRSTNASSARQSNLTYTSNTSTPLTAQSSAHSSAHSSIYLNTSTTHRRSFSRSSVDSSAQPARPSIRRSISLRSPFRGKFSSATSPYDNAALDSQSSGAVDRLPQTEPAHIPLQRAPTFDSFRSLHLRRTNTEQTNMSLANGSLGPAAQIGGSGGANNPQSVYQHIIDTASKRIQTLDYLRKTFETPLLLLICLHYTNLFSQS
jgi:hypothetical protein